MCEHFETDLTVFCPYIRLQKSRPHQFNSFRTYNFSWVRSTTSYKFVDPTFPSFIPMKKSNQHKKYSANEYTLCGNRGVPPVTVSHREFLRDYCLRVHAPQRSLKYSGVQIWRQIRYFWDRPRLTALVKSVVIADRDDTYRPVLWAWETFDVPKKGTILCSASEFYEKKWQWKLTQWCQIWSQKLFSKAWCRPQRKCFACDETQNVRIIVWIVSSIRTTSLPSWEVI